MNIENIKNILKSALDKNLSDKTKIYTTISLAWIIFMIRFYFLPIFLNYEDIGHLSLILEKNIYAIFEKNYFSNL